MADENKFVTEGEIEGASKLTLKKETVRTLRVQSQIKAGEICWFSWFPKGGGGGGTQGGGGAGGGGGVTSG